MHGIALGTALACTVLALATGCAPPAGSTQAGTSKAAPSTAAPKSELLADVDLVLHARAISPGESLAVRLLGTIGPDGNWSLAGIDVEHDATGLCIVPRVRRGNARQVIQMLIPLDEKIWVRLPAGSQRLEVRGSDSTFVESVAVSTGSTPRPPETHMAYRSMTSMTHARDLLSIDTSPGDGFIDAIEVRETRAGVTSEWRILDGCIREGAELVGEIPLPEGHDLQKVEARAVDGQGQRDPSPSLLDVSKP